MYYYCYMDLAVISSSPRGPLKAQAPELLSLLEAYLSAQDVKQNSRENYRRTLRQFFAWIAATGRDLSGLSLPDTIAYKEHLLSSGKSALTVASYITSLRSFYGWAEANKLYPNITRGLKLPKRKQQFRKQPLSHNQSRALLSEFEGLSLRDYAIINLLLRTGLRTVEIIRANVEDITYKSGKRVLLVQGKGRHDRDSFVILTDKAYSPIENYLKSRGRVSSKEPLFTSVSNNSRGGRLTTRTISQIAKTGLRSIGLDSREFTAHSLRHTTGVNILRAGGLLEHAQAVLRHANPATTQIYLATLAEEEQLKVAAEELIDSLY
jgi:integrase/recombinase XerC/integrase/recombinase XerD